MENAATIAGAVVEVDDALIIPALGQVGAVLDYPQELHDGGEELESVEAHISE